MEKGEVQAYCVEPTAPSPESVNTGSTHGSPVSHAENIAVARFMHQSEECSYFVTGCN